MDPMINTGVTRGQYLHGHAKHIDSKDAESAEVCHEVSRDHRRRLANRVFRSGFGLKILETPFVVPT